MSYDDIFDAVREGTVEDVKYFIEKKRVNINVKDDGYTLLHWAAMDDKIEVVKYLISVGADVNVKDNKYATPLHWAVHKGSLEIVKLLVSAGADVNAKDNDGYMPLDIAEGSAMNQYIKSIGGKGSIPSTGQIVGKVVLDEVKKSCYIATAVYGSYDCPQVWTLRRFRDNSLASNFFGRIIIKIYYLISPKILKIFGKSKRFFLFFRKKLDKFINKLEKNGYENTPYYD